MEMNINIEKLLEKYYAGETSLEEEQLLREFLDSQHTDNEYFLEEKIFKLFAQEKQEKDLFSTQQFLQTMDTVKRKTFFSKKLLYFAGGIAACYFMVSSFTFFNNNNSNNSYPVTIDTCEYYPPENDSLFLKASEIILNKHIFPFLKKDFMVFLTDTTYNLICTHEMNQRKIE